MAKLADDILPRLDALQRRGISATLINSSLSPAEQRERIRALARGEFKLVYIAPERFRSRSFLEALGQSTIALFAVDEAGGGLHGDSNGRSAP